MASVTKPHRLVIAHGLVIHPVHPVNPVQISFFPRLSTEWFRLKAVEHAQDGFGDDQPRVGLSSLGMMCQGASAVLGISVVINQT
jgi:hypothetical protein